jgi:hypothetical protein
MHSQRKTNYWRALPPPSTTSTPSPSSLPPPPSHTLRRDQLRMARVSGAPRNRRHTHTSADVRPLYICTAFLLFLRDRKGRRVTRSCAGGLRAGPHVKVSWWIVFGRLFRLILKLFVVPNLKMAWPHTMAEN